MSMRKPNPKRTRRAPDLALAYMMVRVHYSDLLSFARDAMAPCIIGMQEPDDLVLGAIEIKLRVSRCPTDKVEALRYLKGAIPTKVRSLAREHHSVAMHENYPAEGESDAFTCENACG